MIAMERKGGNVSFPSRLGKRECEGGAWEGKREEGDG